MNKAVLAVILSYVGTASFFMVLFSFIPLYIFFRSPLLIGLILLMLFDLGSVIVLLEDYRSKEKQVYDRWEELYNKNKELEERIKELQDKQ